MKDEKMFNKPKLQERYARRFDISSTTPLVSPTPIHSPHPLHPVLSPLPSIPVSTPTPAPSPLPPPLPPVPRIDFQKEFVGMLKANMEKFSPEVFPLIQNFLWVLGKERWSRSRKESKDSKDPYGARMVNGTIHVSGNVAKTSFPLPLFSTVGLGNYKGQKVDVYLNSTKEVMELDVVDTNYVLKPVQPLPAALPDSVSIHVNQSITE